MFKLHSIPVRLTALLLLLLAASFAAEPRRVTVYAPQASYQVDILVREGVDYVGLTDLLEPLGRLESRLQGNRVVLTFNGTAAEFQEGQRQFRAASGRVDLGANFLVVDGRGYLPVASIPAVLPKLIGQAVDFHAAARRLFVGATPIHFSADLRHSPSRLVLTFSAPVSPTSVIEHGRVRLLFRREPVVGNGADNLNYNDPFVLSSSFVETQGEAEFIASVQQPAVVNISDGGRTVTIDAATAQGAQPSAAVVATPAVPAGQPGAAQAPRPARTLPFVVIDAAHGGMESGETLTSGLQEKTVTLALARRLQKELESRGIASVLTRTADNLLTWDQRAVAANTSHASLYVALHASSSGRGVRLYTSLLPAAQPGQTRRSFLPWEQAQSPFLRSSTQSAEAMVGLCSSQGMPARASSAPVRPLNSITLAAVAVEVAPLDGTAEELGTPEYQQKIVAVLASGIASLQGKLEPAP